VSGQHHTPATLTPGKDPVVYDLYPSRTYRLPPVLLYEG